MTHGCWPDEAPGKERTALPIYTYSQQKGTQMLSPGQQKLFEFLKQSESSKRHFTPEDAAMASGLAESSIRTYFSKKLANNWVFNADYRYYEARGIISTSSQEFANVMTQKLSPPIHGYAGWREQLENLIVEGVGEKFPVADTLLEIAASIEDSDHK
jgi:hypothetical protein